ncbi:hypothetical protein D3C71_1680140 [compost metagenome]
MGRALGSIMPTIITTHMANISSASLRLQGMSMPAIAASAMPPGALMLAAMRSNSSQAMPINASRLSSVSHCSLPSGQWGKRCCWPANSSGRLGTFSAPPLAR